MALWTAAEVADLTGLLSSPVEIWRATRSSGAGGGRSVRWRQQAVAAASLQPVPRLPLNVTAAESAALITLWNVYLPLGADVRVGDVLRPQPSGRGVGDTVDAAAWAALPGAALRVDDAGDNASDTPLRLAVAREVTA